MKLLVVGSRSITDIDISVYIPEGIDVIVSGGARGIDSLAEKYADEKRISKYIMRPNYSLYKRGAPIKRNYAMVDFCDKVLVIWDGCSKGAKSTIDYARKCGKPVEVVVIKNAPL